MGAQLNHTIVNVRNKQESARFVADILGLPDPVSFWSFLVVNTANGLTPSPA